MPKRLLLMILALSLLAGIAAAQETPTPSPPPELTPTETPLPLNPLTGEDTPPPIEIDLPEGWQVGYDGFVFNDIGELRVVRFALYTGPLTTDSVGFIVVLWGFTNITAANPITGTGEINLYLDGLRLLRLVLMETECNIGTDLQQDYAIGDRTGRGTQFSAVECPNTPDAAGWFSGLQVDGMNFVFYAFVEPVDTFYEAHPHLQDILDTVEFTVEDWLQPEVTPEPEATAEPDGE